MSEINSKLDTSEEKIHNVKNMQMANIQNIADRRK